MKRTLSNFSQALLGLLLSTLFCGCSSEPELHIFTWANFIKPSLIERFEQEHHCVVVINTFDSNESMYAKLHLGGVGYDVIFPSSYFADLMHKQQLLQPIETALLPNIKFADSKYTNMLEATTAAYVIPYAFTCTAIGYRQDKISIEDPSWGIFDRRSLRGRMTMLNDPREAIGAALKFLGYSINTVNDSEIHAAEEILIGWKHNLAKFENEQYKSGLASAEFLAVQGYGGEILLVHQEDPAVVCVLPKEGTICSLDVMAISNEPQNKELAYAFVNFLLEPEVAVENTLYTQFLITNTAAYEKLPVDVKENPVLFPPPAIAEKSELIKNLGKDTELYIQAWDRVKAAA